MKIGILGSGEVGRTLAKAFKQEGHDVVIATREPNSENAKQLEQDLNIPVKSYADTAGHAEIAVLCTLWAGTENAIQLANPDHLRRKVVIDVTNPLVFHPNKPPTLAVGHKDSGGEQVQKWLEHSDVVKAFNTIGNQDMYKPQFAGGPPTMFYCGNSLHAKQQVADILKAFGWDPLDVGDITSSRELEPLCILWVKYGMMTQNWHHAFKFLRY
jgi:predicted dinucleotide-binding enzyme